MIVRPATFVATLVAFSVLAPILSPLAVMACMAAVSLGYLRVIS